MCLKFDPCLVPAIVAALSSAGSLGVAEVESGIPSMPEEELDPDSASSSLQETEVCPLGLSAATLLETDPELPAKRVLLTGHALPDCGDLTDQESLSLDPRGGSDHEPAVAATYLECEHG